MIQLGKRPYGVTIFCDDIRPEVGGKLSYMGVYNGTMFVAGDLPITFPKFCISVHYHEFVLPEDKRPTGNVPFKIFMPWDEEGTPSLTSEFPMEEARKSSQLAEFREQAPADSDHLILTQAHLAFAPFAISRYGYIRVRAYWGTEEIRLGALRIAPPAGAKSNSPN